MAKLYPPLRANVLDRVGNCTVVWRRYFEQAVTQSEADGDLGDQTLDGGAGVVGNAYYLTTTDNTWLVADWEDETTVDGEVGVCSAGGTIKLRGLINLDSHGLGDNGKPLYVGSSGELVQYVGMDAANIRYSKQVGHIEDENNIRIDISSTYMELDTGSEFIFQNDDSYTFQDGTIYEFN